MHFVMGVVVLGRNDGLEFGVEVVIGGLRLCLAMIFVVVIVGCLTVLHVVVVMRR